MKMSRSEAAVVAARASAQVRRRRVNERYAARLRADGWTCTPPSDQQDTNTPGETREVDQQASESDAVLAAPVAPAVRLPEVPAPAVPVNRCTEHGKVIPHYRCEESERWLDNLAAAAGSSSVGS